MSEEVKVTSDPDLAVLRIEDHPSIMHATTEDMTLSVDTGIHTRDETVTIEGIDSSGETTEFLRITFEDLDEAEAYGEMLAKEARELREHYDLVGHD